MRKKILILFILLLSSTLLAEEKARYTITHFSNKEKNFVFSELRDRQGEIFGHFALIDPDPYYLYSIESDPDMFPLIDLTVDSLALRRGRGRPVAMIAVDFSNQAEIKRPFSFKYLVRYLFLISFSPPYLRKVEVLNPSKISRWFFVEMKIKDKNYFGAMVLKRSFDASGAKEFIEKIPGTGEISLVVPVLENIPVKFVSFSSGEKKVLYESFPGHTNFTCVFLAGTK